MIGSELAGRYRMLREIGRGGMGVVYQAHDPLLDRDVAIKLLNPESMSSSATRRFEREARVIARMDHPSIMNVFDIGWHERSIFFVMPLARGSSLRNVLQRGPLDPAVTVDIAIQVADALHYSHRSGIVHRDIKPENIMISGGGDELRALVTDFGLAVSDGDERLTQSGAVIGTTAYLSPEQIQSHELDPRSDIYSLGVVMYEALAGSLPFEGSLPVTLYRIIHDVPNPPHVKNMAVDRELSRIVMWCLEKNPARRPRDAGQLADALREYKTGSHPVAAPVPIVSPRRRLIGRGREMETIERVLGLAGAGEAQLLLIGGEAGTGKTRLVEEIETVCTLRGIAILGARFPGRDEGFPYQVFSDLLQAHFQTMTVESFRDAFADCAADLLAFFPILREIEPLRQFASGPGLSAGREKRELHELLAGAISRIGRGRPLVIALEELHAASVSIEAIEYLLARLAPVSLLIVGTYRPSELQRNHPLHPLINEASWERRIHVVPLRPLDAEEHRQMLQQFLEQGAVSDAANERIYAVTEGNPFFVQELARSLLESKTLTFDGNEWTLGDEVDFDADALPPTIQRAVERRIEALDPATRAVLETASIIGRSFDIGDLEPLLDLADFEPHLERLVREGFLHEERGHRGERLSFSSALMREVAYGGVARRRRRMLHRKLAALLEERYRGRTEKVLSSLLHHYGEADEPAKVVEYGLQLAHKSLESFSAGEALRAVRLVTDFLDEEDADSRQYEIEAHIVAAKAHRMAGSVDGALRELELASRIAFEARQTELVLAAAADAAETAWEARQIEDAERWVERGMSSGGSSPSTMRRILSIAATIANLRGDADVARELFERADALITDAPRATAQSSRGGMIRIPVSGDLLSLDPALGFTLTHLETLSAVFESLTREGEGFRVAPWLASTIRAEAGGRKFHIELREARFHDGRRVTAADVRYSLQRLLRSSAAESRWMLAPIAGARAYGEGAADTIEGLRVESASRLSIELEEPLSFFPAVLAHLPAAIVPEGTSEVAQGWRESCVGTGPFRVVDFQIDAELRLEASSLYWRQGFPRADGIVFTFGVAPAEIARGLREGIYDIGWDLLPHDFEELRLDPLFARGFRETPRLSTYYIAFNIHKGPLRDEALRREVAASLDTARLIASLGRVAIPARGFIPPGLLGYEPSRRRLPRAVAKHTPRVQLQAMLNSAYLGPYADFASRLFDAFASAGVDISVIEGKSEYVVNQAEALGTAEVLFTRWVADYPDAHDFIALLHTRTGLLGRLCGTPEIDRLIERGARESSPDMRHKIYREIEDILADHAYIVPLFHEQSYRFARPEVRDFAINYFSPIVAYEKLWIA